MPLIYGYSDATRSHNIATLRRDGYPEKQAVAISYKIQRAELRKRHMSTRRRRGLARRNPENSIGAGLGYGAIAIGAGAALGAAFLHPTLPRTVGTLDGAEAGGMVSMAAGILTALFFKRERVTGLAMAALGAAANTAIVIGKVTAIPPTSTMTISGT